MCFRLCLMSAAVFAGLAVLPVSAQQKDAVPAVKAKEISFVASTDKKDAIYKKNKPVVFTVSLKDKADYPGAKIRYRLFRNGNMEKRDTVSAAQDVKVTSSLDAPGWIHLSADLLGADGKAVKDPVRKNRNVKAEIGAMVDPLEIRDAGCEPADFDLFWKSQRKALNEVPIKATRTRVSVPKRYEGKVVLYDVQIDCAGGKPVSGYLAMPVDAKKKSLPAIVYYHGAGVRSSLKQYGGAIHGMIAFDVNAHGIPNGQPAEFYKELSQRELKGYSHSGKNNRDQSYFKGMFLRVMRALDYVKTLPEWNGKVLIVAGGSQGGGQALAAAALDPQVTLCVAGVPAIGDHGGRLVGRRPGWPQLFNNLKPGEADKKNVHASSYFDHNYLAKRIRCETWMGTGFVDMTCPPTSVYAAYNNLPKGVVKHIQTTPSAGHGAPLSSGWARVSKFHTK